MTMKDNITKKLTEAFAPLSLDVSDESHLHAGHMGHRPEGETHFGVNIVSEAFEGHRRIDRHRMINELRGGTCGNGTCAGAETADAEGSGPGFVAAPLHRHSGARAPLGDRAGISAGESPTAPRHVQIPLAASKTRRAPGMASAGWSTSSAKRSPRATFGFSPGAARIQMFEDLLPHARIPELLDVLGNAGHGVIVALAVEEVADLVGHVDQPVSDRAQLPT